MSKLTFHLFVEDSLQERFVVSGLRWAAHNSGQDIEILPVSTTGGVPALQAELKIYAANAQRTGGLPDAIIVCIDGNCKGVAAKSRDINALIPDNMKQQVIVSVPDPHVERWFFSDLEAYHKAIGPCSAPPRKKCDKAAYKNLLGRALKESRVETLLGGAEYVEELVQRFEWSKRTLLDANLGRLFQDLSAVGLR